MNKFVVLIRGINVGGRNKVSMETLRKHLTLQGFHDVTTYIASGNVILQSNIPPREIKDSIERLLVKEFTLDDELIKILVLNQPQLQAIVDNKPKGFGNEPDKYYCDTIFLIDIDTATAMTAFNPKEGVDKVWPGDGVIYSERLSSERTKSHLNRIVGTSAYKSMTIRSWNTTTKLLSLLG